MLKTKFQTLCQNFTHNQNLIDRLWQEIAEAHSQPNRYYHTLKHLEDIYKVLPKLDTVTEFTIFYHDIVYDVLKANNEEQSALLCEERVHLLGVESELITEVTQLIVETKRHKTTSKRNALFLDADLAILGSSKEVYSLYTQNVRQEYAIYSDEIYKEGRRDVLRHFLEKESIYLSHYFYTKYEQQAQENILIEYNSII